MFRLSIALVALVSIPATAQPLTAAERGRIDQLVTSALAKSGVPSAEIAVVRDGRIVLDKAYGKANERLPATSALPYQIASNSKQFTAMALLLLRDDGKLSLEDPVSKYVPGITDGNKVTIRQLLSHTSGLEDYWPQDYMFADMTVPTTPQHIIDNWAKRPLDFQPGDQWQYSNTGYVVAGMIVEKVSGEPLMSYLRRKIFQPLGMASVRDQDDTNTPIFPAPYTRYALGPVRQQAPAAHGWLFAAGELSMTAADLAKWDIARMNRAVLPARDWQEQETEVKLNDGKGTNYGLGVFVQPGPRRSVSHTGEAVGFLSVNTVYPDQHAAVVVLTNSWNTGDAYARIARDIADVILPPAPANGATTPQAARARVLFDELRRGVIDRSLLTPNANFYFSGQALADFKDSLGPLGDPSSFEPKGSPVLRGGFVIQGYTVTYPDRKLSISTFYEPGANGRVEQFLVSPAS
ncbi:MAG TPA: serine hydrolase domain-containing protein [Sphingomicrobium sp.]|nr:serine hydrolase domain-containing protein [Sphingomicrobium sp.]